MKSTSYLGHCSGDDTWANGNLADFAGCPSNNPVVIVEATQIPDSFWWIAGAVALLFFLKKR